ncbi:MAG: hypothetical protein IMF11_08905 [Proteobacteria bacterium]|nr:hypothetical protein [Pseudomonadota bacterium]
MEMRLTSVIEILKQEINPNRPTLDGKKRIPGDYEAGIQHCIDLFTKISVLKGGRIFFEIGSGDDTIVLLIPNDHANHFKRVINLALEKKNEKGRGCYITHAGTFKNQQEG